MERIRSIRLRWLQGGLGQIAYELERNQFSQYARPEGWQPAINAYRCDSAIRVCVDLAGVEKSDIDLLVEPTRVVLRGVRLSPEPSCDEPKARQILAMEIDHGPFVREVHLPVEVSPAEATAEQKNGLLWINLPIFLRS